MGQTGVTDSQAPSSTVATGYTSPWLGQPTSSTVDPGGLALISTTSYEAPGSGYNRVTGSGKPAGSATTTTNAYYAAAATLSVATCGLPVGMPEYGMLASTTDPRPATVFLPASGLLTNYVYDVLGRLVGAKSTGDLGWPAPPTIPAVA
jgi:hypothetical protein